MDLIVCLHQSLAYFFFKFLQNRRIDFTRLEGVVYDHACGLHRYILNREPAQFQNVRFLVDGSHWKAQKKFKKSDKKSDGHLGCSLGYDYNTYKPYTQDGPDGMRNSQSREQMHSVLDKLGKSLRQKNYHNFFRWLISFFAIRNLQKMNKL